MEKAAPNSVEDVRERVEEILRPLAEWMLKCPMKWSDHVTNKWTDRHPDYCTLCRGANRILDPRFEALRYPPIEITTVDDARRRFVPGRGIDAGEGAIIRAAAACGWAVQVVPEGNGFEAMVGHWEERLGSTPAEAMARALVAAVENNRGLKVVADRGRS